MNPDIQRIAEKHFVLHENGEDLLATLKLALTELSAMRDTQERELRALIKKSDLEEVDSCVVASDSCGAPILRNSGKILRHRGYMSEVNEKTKLLQQLASKARENASLLSRIGELEAKYGVQEQLDHIFGQLPSNEEA